MSKAPSWLPGLSWAEPGGPASLTSFGMLFGFRSWLPAMSWAEPGGPATLVKFGLLFGSFGLLFGVVQYTRRNWVEEFAWRLERSDPDCPSNMKPVLPEKQRCFFEKMSDAAGQVGRSITVQEMVHTIKEGSAATSPVSSSGRCVSAVKKLDSAGCKRLSTNRGEKLDMDHVRITYLDYCWGMLAVGGPAVCLWTSGILKLLARQRLERWGWARPAPCDAERVVGLLLMEGIGQLLHCNGLRKLDDGRQVANFSWVDMPLLDNNAEYYQAKLFTVDVDVETKRMVRAKLDADELSAQDAMILVWFDTISASHVKLHAYGNWAVNVDGDVPRYVQKVSLVTVLYNYFGFTVFPFLCDTWYSWGWTGQNWKNIRSVFKQGATADNIKEHKVLRTLLPYSEVTAFVIKLRNHFLNLFAQERETFLGIDGEAFFVGTVLHSLDHTLMSWNLEDPLWLDIGSKRFGVMAQLGRFVRVGFVDDLPFVPRWLNKRYKTAPGQFFRSVYRQARRINPKLAEYMDTCIVK